MPPGIHHREILAWYPAIFVKLLELMWRLGTLSSNELQWSDRMIGPQDDSPSSGHLWPVQHQAIIWTNDGVLLIGTLGTRERD